jgi:hypothetical protein
MLGVQLVAAASRGGLPRTIVFLPMPGMLLSVGAVPAGAGTAASAPRTATAPDAAARQEAQEAGGAGGVHGARAPRAIPRGLH